MNWNRLNPYLADTSKWAGITKAFGSERWKECLPLSGNARESAFRRIYCEQLKSIGNSKFVWNFAMCGEGDQLLNWLFFCTNSLRGLEEMKKAMWHVDDLGEFRFSDGDNPGQLSFFSGVDRGWLADHLHKKFNGRSLSVQEIRDFVLLETPCYLFKESLALLEATGRCEATSAKSRKRGSFSDEETIVKFVDPPDTQLRLI